MDDNEFDAETLAWMEFYKNGWAYGSLPNMREVFQAGWNACINSNEEEE